MVEALKRSSIKRITKEVIQKSCKENHLYHTPELNDVLYLHYQGYDKIESLEEYSGLKCLWLNSNAISEIGGLTSQPNLKCLFLQQNLINKIENLEMCPELDVLNLSHNHIKCVENCGSDVLPKLSSLDLSYNCLTTANSLEALKSCLKLSVLDISNNRIDDILVVKILAGMPELAVLNMTGNPVVSMIPQYRKTLILECLKLNYLDQRPINERDRACALAWRRGGYEAEQKENDRWIKMERDKMYQSARDTLRLRKEAVKMKIDGDVSAREELCLGDTFVGRTFSEDAWDMDSPQNENTLDSCGNFPVVLNEGNSFENEERAQNLVTTEDDELSIAFASCVAIDEAGRGKSLTTTEQVEIPPPLEEDTSIDVDKQDRSIYCKIDDLPPSIGAPIYVEEQTCTMIESTDEYLISPLTEKVLIDVKKGTISVIEAKDNEEDEELSIGFGSCVSVDVARSDKSLNSAEQVENLRPLEEDSSIHADKQDRSIECKIDGLPPSIGAPIYVEEQTCTMIESTDEYLISPLTEKVLIDVKKRPRSLIEAKVNEEDGELSIGFGSCVSVDEARSDKSLNSAEQVENLRPLEEDSSIHADKQDRSIECKIDGLPPSIGAPIYVEEQTCTMIESTDEYLISPLTEKVLIDVKKRPRSLIEAKVNEEDGELSIGFGSCVSVDEARSDKSLNSAEQVENLRPLEEDSSIHADKQDRSIECKIDGLPPSIGAPIYVEEQTCTMIESTDEYLISPLTEKVLIDVKKRPRSLIEAKVNEEDGELSIGFGSCVSVDEARSDKSLNSAEQVENLRPLEEDSSIHADKQDRSIECKIDGLPPSIGAPIYVEEQTCTMIESTDEYLISPLTEKVLIDVEKRSRSLIKAKDNEEDEEISIGFGSCVSIDEARSDKSLNSAEQVENLRPLDKGTSVGADKQDRSIECKIDGLPPSIGAPIYVEEQTCTMLKSTDEQLILPLTEKDPIDVKKRSRSFIEAKVNDHPSLLVEDVPSGVKNRAGSVIQNADEGFPPPLNENVSIDVRKPERNMIMGEDRELSLCLIEDVTMGRKKRSRNMIKGKDGDLPPPLVEDFPIDLKKRARNMIKDKDGDFTKPLIEDVTMDMLKRTENISTLNDSAYKLYDDFETILRDYEGGDYEVVPYEIGTDDSNLNISGKDQPISTFISDKNCTICETPDDCEYTFCDESQNTGKTVNVVAAPN